MKKTERNARDFLGQCQQQLHKTRDLVEKVKTERYVWKQQASLNTALRKNFIWNIKKQIPTPL